MKIHQDIFTQTNCLSEETLAKYASGKLSSVEKREVEKHLIDCEMCSDAAEGLNMIADKNRVSEITLELNQNIQRRVKKSEGKIIFFRQYRTQLAIAASIVVVFGLVWLFRNTLSENELDAVSSQKIFADKFEPYHAEKKTEDNIPVVESPKPHESVAEMSAVENMNSPDGTLDQGKKSISSSNISAGTTKNRVDFSKPGAAGAENIETLAPQAPMEGIVHVDSVILDKATPEQSIYAGARSGRNVNSIMNDVNKNNDTRILKKEEQKQQSKELLALETIPKSEKKKKNSIETQKTQSRIKQVSVASEAAITESNEEIVSVDSVRTSRAAEADVAMQEYNQKKYSKAAGDFEKTLANDPGNYNALFYSSVSYLSTGQEDKAIVNLNKVLAKRNGEFYDAAQWYLSLAYIKKNDLKNARKILLEMQKNPQNKYQKQAEETLKEINR